MPPDSLSITFAALADPTRRAILARLASGACSVTELGGPFAMSMPAVSKHLRVLERAGLIARGRAAQWRPCQLDARPLKAVSDWAEQYRQVWEGRLDRLDDYLQELQARPAGRSRVGAATRPAPPVAAGTPGDRPAAARESAAAKPARRPRDGAPTRPASGDEWRGRSPEPSSGRSANARRQIAAGTLEGRPAAARESAAAKPAKEKSHARHAKRRS